MIAADPHLGHLQHVSLIRDIPILHVVAELEDEDGPVLRALVKAGVDVNEQDSHQFGGYSALHAVALNNRADDIIVLLKAGADVQLKSRLGDSPLHVAASRHQLDAVEVLLEQGGADVKARNAKGETSLHVAAKISSPLVVEALVGIGGADVNDLDENGSTPLHLAAANVSMTTQATAQYLLDAGADERIVNKDGHTAKDVIGRDIGPVENGEGGDVRTLLRTLLEDRQWAANRAWSRRAFAMMGRNRAKRAALAPAELARKEKLAKTDQSCGEVNDSNGGEAMGQGGRATTSWKVVVEWMWDIQEEGIFRNIVAFL